VDELVAEFKKETGITVEPDYGGSGAIITRAALDDQADLFMPGDVWYVDRLEEKTPGRVVSKTSVCYFVPVMIVRADSTRKIETLADLFQDDLTVALGDPSPGGPQVGRLTVKIFEKNGLDYGKLEKKLDTGLLMRSATVNELGVWVKSKTADAAIVWDAIAENIRDHVRVIPIPLERNIISRVVVGQLKTSKHPEQARKFIDFMKSPKGRDILNRNGYRTEAPR
jgi:molybdate transport system substrate-binding protein